MIPAVTQVPPIFWIRFFLPVVVTLGAGLLLWGWRRSGKDFNLFLWELHFPAGTDPSRVAQFFDRLKWFLLPAGVAPLVWLGCDLYWIYLNCPSYLFPELNLDGLKQVSSRLESLPQRINNLEVDPHVRESLLARYKVLVEKYNQLTYFLVVVDDVIRPCYPGGVSPEYKINPASLLRRVMPLVALIVLAGLVFLSRKKNNPTTPRGVPLVFFFFNGDGFLEEWSFFFYSFAFFFLLICLIFKLKGSPTGGITFLSRVIPVKHQEHPLVEESLRRFREITQPAIAVELSLWWAVMLVMAKVSPSTPALLFGLTTISKIGLLCYRTGLFCLDKLLNLEGIPPNTYQELAELSVEGQNLYFGFRQFRSRLFQLENSALTFSPGWFWGLLIFLGVALLFWLFYNRKTHLFKSVYLLILPTTQVPALWVRFLFPVLATLAVGYLLTRWRRSGLGWEEFCREYFFRPEVSPQAISLFLKRLGWVVLVGAFVPVGVAWVECYWMYFYCHSYLYLELGLTGLQEVIPYLEAYRGRLQSLIDRPDVYDPTQVGYLV